MTPAEDRLARTGLSLPPPTRTPAGGALPVAIKIEAEMRWHG